MQIDPITIKPDVCGAKPTIRGMRITVSHVLEMLAGGMTPEQVLQDFAYLEKADIDACLEHAARHANPPALPFRSCWPNQRNWSIRCSV